MASTNLLYLNDFGVVTNEALVVEIIKENEQDIVVLNQTAFYPQGGGQPYDTGLIKSSSSQFAVEEVRIINDIVRHIGTFEKGCFNKNDGVDCIIDKERRILNNRLHSAGHVVDMAVLQLGLGWTPGKGHHFPTGPYVEYSGFLDGLDKEKLKSDLEALCNQFIQEGRQTHLMFVDRENLQSLCHFVPDYAPYDKPVRVVVFGDNFAVPCGGTHVKNISEIKSMTIRKIRMEKGSVRVSYDIAMISPVSFDSNDKATNGKSDISIRPSQVCDIPGIVQMSNQKRRSYEKAQPQFWKYAGPDAEISQAKWFEELLTQGDYIMLTAVRHEKIVGFIIGKLMPAPEVYNPGGLTLMIDDFCVEDETGWKSAGCKLIQEIKIISKMKDAAQILIVCGAHDEPKRRFLKSIGLTVASEWYVGGIV